jgi:hypothetical protein
MIIDTVGVVICWGNISINWGRSISWSRCIGWGRSIDGCWGILGSSRGNGHKGKQSNKALKEKMSNKNVTNISNLFLNCIKILIFKFVVLKICFTFMIG